MRILFCGSGWFPIVGAIEARVPSNVTIKSRDFTRPLEEQLKDVQVILPSNAAIDREAIAAPSSLLLIQQPAVGYEAIDLDAARARGVPVCNAPGTNGASVAEAALLLILSLARKLRPALRAFEDAEIGGPLGRELAGKVLGIVGVGQSGSRLAAAARGIGMDVRTVRSTSSSEDFHALLRASDFVSIHCPLTPATRGLFEAATFAEMKPGACLINCARGAIVDRAAVEAALDSGRLRGLGLDTYWAEPWDPRSALYRRDDVVALPHIAGSTEEAFGRVADIVAENIRRIERGEPLLHRVA